MREDHHAIFRPTELLQLLSDDRPELPCALFDAAGRMNGRNDDRMAELFERDVDSVVIAQLQLADAELGSAENPVMQHDWRGRFLPHCFHTLRRRYNELP